MFKDDYLDYLDHASLPLDARNILRMRFAALATENRKIVKAKYKEEYAEEMIKIILVEIEKGRQNKD